MTVKQLPTAEALGRTCAAHAAELLRTAIDARGAARLLVSTGASQFTTLAALATEAVDWSRVTLFHLDEYIGLSESHPASFRLYLRRRFVAQLPTPLSAAVWVTGDPSPAALRALSEAVTAAPIDVGLIGIGENTHIAFNDPPADFSADAPYLVVTLDDACRRQQLGEGWFESLDAVPTRAVSMSCRQILTCTAILSAVPYAVKAEAVRRTLAAAVPTPLVPASLLHTHPDWTLYLDADSASLLEKGGPPAV